LNEIEKLQQAIASLEAQRHVLGDEIVETTLATLRDKLAALQPLTAHPEPEHGNVEQRRLVTILFADLVGSTALAEKLDPEDLRDALNAYFKRWTICIEEHSGQVEKFIGDAVMAVFGLIAAHEDDTENAIRAALVMREELDTLNEDFDRLYGIKLGMRVAVHTGPVVVSTLDERKGQDFVVVGDAVNLTSRLQSIAPSGGILISYEAYRHVRGIFDVKSLEAVQLKGISQPMQVYLVLRAKPRAFRLSKRGVEGIETQLVGRQAELHCLQDTFHKVIENGSLKWVDVIGEAGVGKSRLIYEFDNWLELLPQEIYYFKGRASHSRQNQAYSLVHDLFAFRFQIMESDPPEVVRGKWDRGIAESLGQSGFSNPEIEGHTHDIGRLLGFEFGTNQAGSRSDGLLMRDHAIAYLTDYFKTLAAKSPLVLLLEDVHWADNSSLDVIENLQSTLASQPILCVSAARPSLLEQRPSWGKATHVRLKLGPFSPQDSRRLVGDILQRVDNLPESLCDLIVDNAEGNPFYIEELIKMFLEERVILKREEHWEVDLGRLTGLSVPPTLTGVLQSRLDSLPVEEQLLLQRAAVVGRIFWDKAVIALGDDDMPGETDNELDDLQARELVYKHTQSVFDNTREYLFKHALLREVTYASMLKRLRRVYHARAARWLEQITGRSQRTDEYAALIAAHFDEAAEPETALTWYWRAAKSAAARYANSEALHCYTRALELVPQKDLAARYELLMGREAIYALKGARAAQYQDIESLEILVGAWEDGEQGANRRAQVLLRQTRYLVATGDYKSATETAQRAIELARAAGSICLEAECSLACGVAYWRHSDLKSAIDQLERALTLARQSQLVSLEADCLHSLGVVAEMQSDYPAAQDYLEKALQLYREQDNQRGEGGALNSLGVVATKKNDLAAARVNLEGALRLKRQIGDRYGEGVVLANLGFIANTVGDIPATQEYFRQNLNLCREIDDREGEATALAGLASALSDVGNYDLARAHQEQALAIVLEIGDRQGECTLLLNLSRHHHLVGDDETALRYARLALTIAEDEGFRSEQASGSNHLGNAQEGLQHLAEAEEAYRRAAEIHSELGQVSLTINPQANLARVSLARGDIAGAHRLIGEILDFLDAGEVGEMQMEGNESRFAHRLEELTDAFDVCLTCFRVLKAANSPAAVPFLLLAFRQLEKRAARLPEDVQPSFMQNVPANRELAAAYDLMLSQGREASQRAC
jgi:class 3 adenylate cyclase/tetratricopeptide (TPR) repeat protein